MRKWCQVHGMPSMHSTATYSLIFCAGLPRNSCIHHALGITSISCPFRDFSPFMRAYNGNASKSSGGRTSALGTLKKMAYCMLSKTTVTASPAPHNCCSTEIPLRSLTTVSQMLHFHAPSSSFCHSSLDQIDINNDSSAVGIASLSIVDFMKFEVHSPQL